jgi:hypothetical protein
MAGKQFHNKESIRVFLALYYLVNFVFCQEGVAFPFPL